MLLWRLVELLASSPGGPRARRRAPRDLPSWESGSAPWSEVLPKTPAPPGSQDGPDKLPQQVLLGKLWATAQLRGRNTVPSWHEAFSQLSVGMCARSAIRSCPTLCDLMDCGPPGSSAHGILQARVLGWVTLPSASGSCPPRDHTCIS